ncbi:glycosyltransferase [Saccharolobus solfataricus]|uniref:Glycosyltransferase n=1 Tax=Saccharolobus solfataricus TaxID=2287 RepID=A0A7S9NQD9_SACSO|nr:glycosyltransferase [Saccharolobus solfataricus]QPG48954.1 glycosyltransferase [Saccharolobus solfataricus]
MISVIIPAFNEERRIGKTLEKISSTLPNAEVVVVFDGHDNTPEVVKKFPVKLIISKERLGKGMALKRGITESNFQRVLLLDADFPITEEELNKILSTDADLVIPRRKIIGMPLKRRFLHKAFIVLTKILFPSLLKFSDFQAGVKLVNREKVVSVLDELIINDFLFDVNLIYAFKRRHYKIKEVEINYIHDKSDSKISRKLMKIVILMFLSLIKLRIYYSPFKKILYTEPYLKVQGYILSKLR